jgi:hypothetical protein
MNKMEKNGIEWNRMEWNGMNAWTRKGKQAIYGLIPFFWCFLR